MKHFLLIILLAAGNQGYSQKPNTVITRFYQLTGTIDKFPVTFLLHRVNEEFSGSYYYHSTRMPLPIAGKLDKDGFLTLTYVADQEAANEVIQGTFKDSVFSGSWQSKGKMLTMRVTQSMQAPPISFDFIWASGAKKISNKEPHLAHIDECTYDGRAVWPKAGSTHPATKLVQQTVREMLLEENSNEEAGQIMLRHKNRYLNYKEDDDIIYYELSESVEIEYADERLLVLLASSSSYTGGAHGSYASFYENIDLVNNRKLTLNDVMDTTAAKKTVEKLLEKEFVRKFPLDKDEKLSDVLLAEKITYDDNFKVSGRGITFSYIPYKIAAYVYGQIELFIPYKQIESYLKPEFKKLVAFQ